MKNFLLALIVLAAAASVASAGVAVMWSVQNWAESHDSVGSSTGLLDNNDALWQLIYAGPNNAAEPITGAGSANPANDYLAVGSDDVVWAQRTIVQGGGTAPEDSTTWDTWLSPQSGFVTYQDAAWSTAGFVYQRVFESATPITGTWFYETALLALNTGWTPGGANQDFFLDAGLPFAQPNQQAVVAGVIPEPATMGLMGLGALVLAIRRRRA